MNTIKGVVFDLDGVVVDTEHLWERSWAAACASRGQVWRSDHTANAQGMSRPEWAAYVAEVAGEPDQAAAIGEECVHDLLEAIAAGKADLLEGAHELVQAVAERVPVALASSAARPVIDAVLDTHELAATFTATVSSEEVARGKPSPDVYLAAAERIGLDTASGCAVEDSSNGIRAAHAAGLAVVALPHPEYPPHPQAAALATYVAESHQAARRFLLDHTDRLGGQ